MVEDRAMGFEQAIFFGYERTGRAKIELAWRWHAQGRAFHEGRDEENGRFYVARTRLRLYAGARRMQKSNRLWQVVGS